MAKQKALWKKAPDRKDFDAALEYLSLLYSDAQAARLQRDLIRAMTVTRDAKDLLRASGLPLLSREEPHVDADLRRIQKGKPLAPVLLVRGDMTRYLPLIVADGYHRICAICYFDENAPVPCRLAELKRDANSD